MKEVKYPSSASALPSDTHIRHKIFRDPSADDGIIRHNQSRHEKRQIAEKAPALFERPKRLQCILLRLPPDRYIRSQKHKAEGRVQAQGTRAGRARRRPSHINTGKRQIFPTPTALPAAARTNPIEPLKLFFSFICFSLLCRYHHCINIQ